FSSRAHGGFRCSPPRRTIRAHPLTPARGPAVPHHDAASAECLVLTYKEGLLSAVAHDLSIRVGSFTVTVNEEPLAARARFDAGSLRVVSAVHDGAPRPDALSDADK